MRRSTRAAADVPARPFRRIAPEVLRDLVADHPLGLLVTQNRAGGIDANSVPFFLDAERRRHAGRAARATSRAPIRSGTSARDDVDSLVVFQGPQGYVSPAWYPSKAEHGKVVPTWNYVMVQARGTAARDRRQGLAARAS